MYAASLAFRNGQSLLAMILCSDHRISSQALILATMTVGQARDRLCCQILRPRTCDWESFLYILVISNLASIQSCKYCEWPFLSVVFCFRWRDAALSSFDWSIHWSINLSEWIFVSDSESSTRSEQSWRGDKSFYMWVLLKYIGCNLVHLVSLISLLWPSGKSSVSPRDLFHGVAGLTTCR